jgi:cellulose synthase/poly-beta-1,6-N-acetylglucosamine synthase-like glycosyltransferase/peptidoglycan/xylan/chitin deacetylase (PgdA/CDA1 family)
MIRGRLRGARRRDAVRLRRRIWSPPGHWWLLALCLVALVVVVLLQGIATHTIGAYSESAPARTGSSALPGGRSLFSAAGDRLRSRQPPPERRIALTFDDGPDPRWTPRIAALLRRERVPATFFVVGAEAARHPGIVRELARDGHLIGNHTFTHAQLESGARWRQRLELNLSQAVILGITSRYTRLVRPPYVGTPDTVDRGTERRLAQAAGERYVVALSDLDSKDWQRPGVASIVRNATPQGAQGGTVLFHDGGGDRSQTVAALEQLIPSLRARGFEFVSLAELAGVSPAALAPATSPGARWRGSAFAASARFAFLFVSALSVAMLLVGALVLARALVLVALASHHARATRGRVATEHLPSVAVIVPAYNEEVGIERAVRSLLASDYPDLEVVVVDDGSTDATASVVEGMASDRLTIVRQDNAGKAAALNTGVRLTSSDVVVMVDGDTVFEPETVRELVRPLADERAGAVAGNTKVGNRGGLLGRWQHIEYVVGFNLDRRMYDVLQCTPTVPGAIGAFRRDALIEVGGVSGDTLAEDTDLTLAIGRTGRRVVYAERARAWTEAPSTFSGLWRQRYRWSYGTMQAVWKHRHALLSRSPREARIGRRALPYMLCFQIVLPMLAPLIDLFALYGIAFSNPLRVALAWIAFNAIQLALAVYAFRLDREPLRPLWALPLQQFVYRQLMYLVIIESTISALIGVRARWQTIPRTGDVDVPAYGRPSGPASA